MKLRPARRLIMSITGEENDLKVKKTFKSKKVKE